MTIHLTISCRGGSYHLIFSVIKCQWRQSTFFCSKRIAYVFTPTHA